MNICLKKIIIITDANLEIIVWCIIDRYGIFSLDLINMLVKSFIFSSQIGVSIYWDNVGCAERDLKKKLFYSFHYGFRKGCFLKKNFLIFLLYQRRNLITFTRACWIFVAITRFQRLILFSSTLIHYSKIYESI